jgi:hypothetical protein
LNRNAIVGYSKQKAGIRLMVPSRADSGESDLTPGTGKFRDAPKAYTSPERTDKADREFWLRQSKEIRWNYKNV